MELKGIKDWLDGNGDYQSGVALYERHGQSNSLKDLFRKGEFKFTRDKLRSALESLLEGNVPGSFSGTFVQNSPESAAKPALSLPKPAESVHKPSKPDLQPRLRPLLDERTMLHAQLARMPKIECQAACLRIVELTKEITAIYFALEKPVVDPLDYSHITDRAELKQTLQNLRSLHSKIKNKKPERLGELPMLEAKINTVSQILKPQTNDN